VQRTQHGGRLRVRRDERRSDPGGVHELGQSRGAGHAAHQQHRAVDARPVEHRPQRRDRAGEHHREDRRDTGLR
jgi:hypothetical protein